jgi:hypothetical protein
MHITARHIRSRDHLARTSALGYTAERAQSLALTSATPSIIYRQLPPFRPPLHTLLYSTGCMFSGCIDRWAREMKVRRRSLWCGRNDLDCYQIRGQIACSKTGLWAESREMADKWNAGAVRICWGMVPR